MKQCSRLELAYHAVSSFGSIQPVQLQMRLIKGDCLYTECLCTGGGKTTYSHRTMEQTAEYTHVHAHALTHTEDR